MKEASRARHTTRQPCVNLITQLPKELKSPLRRWVMEKGVELTAEYGRAFMVEVRTVLAEKGIADDQVWRRREMRKPMPVQKGDSCIGESRSRKDVSQPMMTRMSEDKANKGEYSSSEEEQVNLVRKQNKYRERIQTDKLQSGVNCYTCRKKGHVWKFCPDRRCAICGERGHARFRCPRVEPVAGSDMKRQPNEIIDRVYQVGSEEDAVTIEVKVKGVGECSFT